MTNYKPNIMVVEDEEIVASDIKLSLLDYGYNVISTASCGEEAIDIFTKKNADLVVMDIKLAGIMDGIETASKIKEIDSNTTIIYLTSFRDELAISRAKATEPSAYILKPFQKDELYSTIEMAFQRQQSEKKLIRSNTELEEFAGMISHDLRSPLQSLMLCQELLMRSIKLSNLEDAEMYARETLNIAKRMNMQIETILSYSKATKKSKCSTTVDINEVMKDCISNLAMIILRKDAEINFSNLPEINIDKVQITQVFQNLINNAINSCKDKKPCIKIKSLFKNNKYLFSIKDNGSGIKEKDLEKVFHVFERLSSSKKYVGSGIGLSICKKIIENYGGKIWIKSRVGEGTTVFFTIPKE